MLYLLKFLSFQVGPLRLMGSHLILLCLGALSAGLVLFVALPRLKSRMPKDRGKALVKDGQASEGKPTGAGFWMIVMMLPVLFLVLPLSASHAPDGLASSEMWDYIKDCLASPSKWHLLLNQQWGVVVCLVLAMLTGYADDCAAVPWGRWKKGLWDAAISVVTAYFLCLGQPMEWWWPISKAITTIPPIVYIPVAAFIIWFSMNATNCTDGVDGLAGSLTLISLLALSAFLYGAVGHQVIAKYLLIPHNEEGARWAILTATVAGGIAGYLWYNAYPSSMMMGDAGSRPLGLLVGVAVLASGNPFLILVVSFVVLVNGGTGMLKIVLLKLFRALGFDTTNTRALSEEARRAHHGQPGVIKALHKWRFPLHDEFKGRGWSNPQVLMRFVLMQSFITPILFLIIVKVR